MAEYDNIRLHGLSVKDQLNPDLFGSGKRIKPNVRKALLRIADEFWEYLDIDYDFKDVRIVGSAVNYNYTPTSDIDLHLIFDFSEFENCPDDEEFIREYLLSKKKTFNGDHDIEIYGAEVELYPEDISDDTESSAIYSVKENRWITQPSQKDVQINRDSAENYVRKFKRKIDQLERIEDPKKKYDRAKQVKDKLFQMRTQGLNRGGEFNVRNIAYKTLRNDGDVEDLFEFMVEAYDELFSIKEPEDNN